MLAYQQIIQNDEDLEKRVNDLKINTSQVWWLFIIINMTIATTKRNFFFLFRINTKLSKCFLSRVHKYRFDLNDVRFSIFICPGQIQKYSK